MYRAGDVALCRKRRAHRRNDLVEKSRCSEAQVLGRRLKRRFSALRSRR